MLTTRPCHTRPKSDRDLFAASQLGFGTTVLALDWRVIPVVVHKTRQFWWSTLSLAHEFSLSQETADTNSPYSPLADSKDLNVCNSRVSRSKHQNASCPVDSGHNRIQSVSFLLIGNEECHNQTKMKKKCIKMPFSNSYSKIAIYNQQARTTWIFRFIL